MTDKFGMGDLVITQGIYALMFPNGELRISDNDWQLLRFARGYFLMGGTDTAKQVLGYLNAHMQGDWGIVGDEDKASNDEGLTPENQDRLLSAYMVGDVKIWIITEWDRSVTTILLPDEY